MWLAFIYRFRAKCMLYIYMHANIHTSMIWQMHAHALIDAYMLALKCMELPSQQREKVGLLRCLDQTQSLV